MEIKREKGKVLVTIGEETKPIAQWAKQYGLSEKTLAGRINAGWDEKDLFNTPGQWKRKPKFNENYFDEINDEHKAYWLGFIWADGYISIRNRDDRISYEFKLSIKQDDWEHLVKFNSDLNGKYTVKFYNQQTSFGEYTEARLLITNQHFGKVLSEKYGIVPHRSDCSKILQSIPEYLIKHFIRGLVDADGSFTHYTISGRCQEYDKFSLSIGTNEDILRKIESYLINNNLINDGSRKVYQRHDGKDGEYKTLQLSGRIQVVDVLNHIYKDATIYLNRKYKKYLDVVRSGGYVVDEL